MTILNAYLVLEFIRQAYHTSFFGQIVRDERGTGVRLMNKQKHIE